MILTQLCGIIYVTSFEKYFESTELAEIDWNLIESYLAPRNGVISCVANGLARIIHYLLDCCHKVRRRINW